METFRQPFQNEYVITQGYGDTITSKFHTGIDYGTPFGTSILASSDGKVMLASWDETGYGNVVILQHNHGIATLYAHLSDIYVKKGENVKQGQLLGHSGNSGNSTGPHLHFEARKQWNNFSTHFNPMSLPLISVDDSISEIHSKWDEKKLLNPNDLKVGNVSIVCSDGAYVHDKNFLVKKAYPSGSVFKFTGNSENKNGIEYCECTVWIAANDGETQILNNV